MVLLGKPSQLQDQNSFLGGTGFTKPCWYSGALPCILVHYNNTSWVKMIHQLFLREARCLRCPHYNNTHHLGIIPAF
jgi:hypothetical protein